jgi:hypothetical protein
MVVAVICTSGSEYDAGGAAIAATVAVSSASRSGFSKLAVASMPRRRS